MNKWFSRPADGGRVFRSGIWAAALTATAVLLAVLVNLLVRAIPSRYTTFDLSEAGLYTLSESSVEVVRTLPQEVSVYYLAQTGSEDVILTRLLQNYAEVGRNFHWECKDPALYPTFAAQYGAQDAAEGSLIVVCGEQSLVLDAAELYEQDYSDYYLTGTASVTFDGESILTSTLYRMTSGESKKVYYTTNHGEAAPTATLTEALENQNLTLEALDLLTQSIPDDCALLIVQNPAQDLAGAGLLVDEVAQLRRYLEGGGALLVTTDSYNATPNLDALLAEFGLTRQEGLVVEGDTAHYLNGYPALYLLPDYVQGGESGLLDGVDTGRGVLLQMAQGIVLTQTENVTIEALLTTSAKAYSKAEGYQMEMLERADTDAEGPFVLAAYALQEQTGAQVVWINCGNMDNEGIYQVLPGNVTFLQACAAGLAGQESATLIESKALEAAPIEVSAPTAAALGVVFVLAIPAVLLAAGGVVVLLRRRR